MDQTARTTWAKLVVMSACAIVPFFGMGCEDAQSSADREVGQKIMDASLAAYEEDSADRVVQLFQEATQVQDASDTAKAKASHRVAQAHYAAAIAKLGALSEAEGLVKQRMEEIGQLGTRLMANNRLIEVYKGNDPLTATQREPLKALEASKARNAKLIADIDAQIAATRKPIEAKNVELTNLESGRTQAATEADSLMLQSEQAEGQTSVDLYAQAVTARARASNLAYSIDNKKVEIARLGQLVTELQQQKKTAQEGIAAADKQIAQLKKVSADVQKAIQARVSAGKGIATQGVELVAAANLREAGIETKGKELAAALAAADEQRKAIDADLASAIQSYDAAATAANRPYAQLEQKLRELPNDSPRRAALEEFKRLHSPMRYNTDRARMLQARGGLYGTQKAILEAKQLLIQSLVPAFKDAKFQLPAELNPQGVAKEIQETRKTAEECYQQAELILEDVMGRGEPNEQAAARFPRIGGLYSLYTLSGANKHLASARELLKEMAGGGEGAEPGVFAKTIPVLPAELEQGIIKRQATGQGGTNAGSAAGNAASPQPAQSPENQ